MDASQTFADAIQAAVGDLEGRIGVAGRDLRTGAEFLLNPDDQFPTASMIKLPILLELFRSGVDLSQRVTLSLEDRTRGSGVLKSLEPGLQPTVRDLAFLMMSISDNTATNVLIRMLGVEAVNATLRREGLSALELRNPIDLDLLRIDPGHLGVGTPRAFMELMERVYRRAIVSPEACGRMMELMANVGPDRIPRYLPYHPNGPDLDPSRPWLKEAGKTGTLFGVAGHVAVVWGEEAELVLAVMTAGSTDLTFGTDHPQTLAIARVGRLIFDLCRTGGRLVVRVPVSSTMLRSVGYDARTRTLEVELQNRVVYRYFKVPPETHAALMSAPSPGTYFNTQVREKFLYERVD